MTTNVEKLGSIHSFEYFMNSTTDGETTDHV